MTVAADPPLTTTYLRLAVATAGVAVTRFLLRTIGFAPTLRLYRKVPMLGVGRPEPDPRWAPEIAAAANRPVGGTCLDRTVLLWLVLRQHGMLGTIRIGVARHDDGIVGHAWLEWRGSVLNDTPDVADRFAPFDGDPTEMAFS